MKRTLISALLLIAFQVLNIPANAQQKKMASPETRATKLTEWMKTNLQLTTEQESKVQEISLKYANMNQ